MSDAEDTANNRDFIVEDYDSEVDDPSTFPEFVPSCKTGLCDLIVCICGHPAGDREDSEVEEDCEDPEAQRLVEAGFEVCRRVWFADDDAGSTDRRCVLREPTTQVDPRATYLEQSIGEARIALLR